MHTCIHACVLWDICGVRHHVVFAFGCKCIVSENIPHQVPIMYPVIAFYNSSSRSQLTCPRSFQLLLRQHPETNFDKLFLLHSSEVMMQCMQKLLFCFNFSLQNSQENFVYLYKWHRYSLSPSPAVLFKVYRALNIDTFVRMQKVWKDSKKWKSCRLSTLFFSAAFCLCLCVGILGNHWRWNLWAENLQFY